MFFARRDRSRASIKRAATVLTLAAFISTGFSFGVLAPSRGTVAVAATPTVDAPALRSDPPDGKGKVKKDNAHAQGKKFRTVDRDVCTDQDDECEDTFDPD